jgi:hypothetical protein
MRFARNLKAIWNGSQNARFVARSLSDDGWSVWDRRERRFLNRREIARLTPSDLDGSANFDLDAQLAADFSRPRREVRLVQLARSLFARTKCGIRP